MEQALEKCESYYVEADCGGRAKRCMVSDRYIVGEATAIALMLRFYE